MHGPEARTLTCPVCDTSYAVDPFVPGRHYRCTRCDQGLSGPEPTSLDSARSRPDTVWLYGRAAQTPRPPRPKLGPDARRIGRYVLLDELGRGAMGVVYRAWDADLSRQVALKVLLAGDHSAHEQVERFLREARAAARLHHPGIVRVHDIGWHDERVYFTMDLVDGPTLQEVLDEVGALPVAEAARIGAAVARALYEAHRRGVVHRDVKPGNVLLRTDGTALIADFGLASEVEADAARLTRSGQVLGTPAYMAPEQATRGTDAPQPLSDQYSLGAILYEMLAGEPPYPGEGAMEVLVALLSGPPEPLARRGRRLPRELVIICEQAMARDPGRRYHNSRTLAEDLERFLRGEPIRARPPGLLQRLQSAVRRNRLPLTLAATAMAGAMVSYQGWRLWTQHQSQRAQQAREARASEHLASTEVRIGELRSGGDLLGADEVWQAFVAEPSHRGTEALARGQLREADRQRVSGDPDAAVDALAAAYAAAGSPELQDEALRGLADLFHDRWAWDQLSVVLETLQTRRGGTQEADARHWRRDARLALRDLHGAADALAEDAPELPLLQALSPAEPAAHLDGRSELIDLQGDGVHELLVVDGDARRGRVVGLVPGLPTLRRVAFPDDLPPPVHILPVDTVPPRIIARAGGADQVAVVLRVDDAEALVEELRWPEAALGDAIATDLDGDGRVEIHVGVGPYARRLLRLEPMGSTWSIRSPHPATDAAASDVSVLAAADVDRDGSDELLVGVGAWSAYDLRVLDPGPRGLTWHARAKLGVVSDLLPLPDGRFLVAKSDRYPNQVVFPADAPWGEPSGVWRARLDGAELRLEPVMPNPVPDAGTHASMVGNLIVADLDGDGWPELVASLSDSVHQQATLIARGVEGGWHDEPLILGGTHPVAAPQLDDDPGMELIVRLTEGEDPTTWVLGLGSGALPSLGRGLPSRAATPETAGDVSQLRAWSRAEDLVSMGLAAQAADQLEQLAGLLDDPGLADRARARTAALAHDLGQPRRAARLFEEASRTASLAPVTLGGALHGLLDDHAFAEALRVGRLAITHAPDDELAARQRDLRRLEELVASAHTQVWDATTELPDGLQVHDPVAVRWTPPRGADPGGLRVEALANDDTLLSAPFQWSGDHLALRADLSLERLEWAGGLSLRLQGPGDAEPFSIDLRGWGGGDVQERELRCGLPRGVEAADRRPVAGATDPAHLQVRLDLSALTDTAICEIIVDGEPLLREELPLPQMPDPGTWRLEVAPSDHAGLDIPMAATVRLHELELTATGLVVQPAPTDPWIRALVLDDPQAAVDGIDPLDGDGARSVWRAAALADTGAWEGSVAALRLLLARHDPAIDQEVVHLLRTRTAAFGPVLQEAAGTELPTWFLQAWAAALHQHHRDDRVRRVLTTSLGTLAGPAPGASPEQASGLVTLLTARGRAWADLGERGAARRDLRAAARSATRLLPALHGQSLRELRERLSVIHRELAAIEASDGDRDAALQHARDAVAYAAAPEVALDAMLARSELAGLRDDPRFRALQAEATPGAG